MKWFILKTEQLNRKSLGHLTMHKDVLKKQRLGSCQRDAGFNLNKWPKLE